MPRKPKYEEQVSIVEHLLALNYFETACAAAGVRPSLGREWLALGAEPGCDPVFATFRTEALKAMGTAEAKIVADLVDSKDSKVMLQLLERRYPDRWHPKVRTVVEEQLRAAIARVDSLEAVIGREALERVRDALSGDIVGPESEDEETAGVH